MLTSQLNQLDAAIIVGETGSGKEPELCARADVMKTTKRSVNSTTQKEVEGMKWVRKKSTSNRQKADKHTEEEEDLVCRFCGEPGVRTMI